MTRRICKVVSMMLILAMVIQLIPKRLFVQAETISLIPEAIAGAQDHASAQLGTSTQETPATIVGEMVEKRTENAKYFRLSDGSYSVAQYMYDVHFKTENGYIPYDNTLCAVRSGDKTTYQPARSDLGISFAGNDIQDGIFTFGRDGYTVSVALVDTHLSTSTKTVTASVQAKREAPVYADQWEAQMDMRDTVSAISYNNVLSDTTLSYTLLGSTIKESIVLYQKPAKSSWKFKLTLNGLVAALQENGDVYLIAKDTKTVAYTIPKGYMFDANNYVSEDVTYTLESCKDGVYLTVHADAAWLNASDRVYPVTVDPTFFVNNTPNVTIRDAHVLEGNPTLNTKWYNILMAGYASGSTFLNMRSYIKLNTLPTLPASSEITSAHLQIQQVPSGQWYSYNSTKNYIHIGAYEVLGTWDDGTITWNNQPAVEDSPVDYITTTAATANQLFKINVTTIAKKWYTTSSSNQGIMLRAEPINWKGQVSFVSGNDASNTKPCLYISYRDMRGIEDVYSYDQESVGNAGTGYVNLYTGNLVFAQGGMTSAGSILPIQVGLVYNGYQKGLPFTKNANNINAPITGTFPIHTGYGWKLNILETIQPKTVNAGTAEEEMFLVYTDGDGTEIYFREHSSAEQANQYYSEDGHPVTITVLDDGQYVMEDDAHNKKWFDPNGRFVTLEDTQGNEKEIIYNIGFPVEIRYNHSGTLEEYVDFFLEYNSAGALIKVINGRDTTRYVEYLYADTYNGTPTLTGYKYLREVRYSTGETVTYTYLSDSALASARDEQNKIEVRYSYNGTKVSQIEVFSGSSTLLTDRRIYTYKDKSTTVRTRGGDDIPGNSDDYMNVYMFDEYGRTVSCHTENLAGSEIYSIAHTAYNNATGENNVRQHNTISRQTSSGSIAQNLILNGNCESWNYWTSICDPMKGYVSLVKAQKVYGEYAFVISMSERDNASIIQECIAPVSGTYTLSAYVRVLQSENALGGAKILLNEAASLPCGKNANSVNGWERISVSKYYAAGETITVTLQAENSEGVTCFDCVQLETGSSASSYNLVSTGNFDSLGGAWEIEPSGYGYIENDAGMDGSGVRLIGGINYYCTFTQSIPIHKAAESMAFVVSGWGKGKVVAPKDGNVTSNNQAYASAGRDFAICVEIQYSDGNKEVHYVPFNPQIWGEWQFTSGTIRPSEPDVVIEYIEISPYLTRNVSSACFDNFSLIMAPVVDYEYDSDGLLTAVREANGNRQEMTYSNRQLATLKTHVNDTTEYRYQYYPSYGLYKHKLRSVLYPNGTEEYYMEYDYYGNVMDQITYSSGSGEIWTEQSYTYDYYGNFLSGETNLHGTTLYDYNEATGVLNYVQNANNNRTAYIYDASGKLLQVFADGNKNGSKESTEQGVQYVYDTQNRLIRIVTASTTYHFTYNDYGQTTAITVGNRTTPLARYTYNAYGGKLTRTDYADGTYIINDYDYHGRIASVSYNGTVLYTVEYNGQGNVSSYVDASTGYRYRYDYDEIDRIRQYWVIFNNEVIMKVTYGYESDTGRLERVQRVIGDYGTSDLQYTYNANGDLYTVTMEDGQEIVLTYDAMNRLSSQSTQHGDMPVSMEYTYYTTADGYTSDRVTSIRFAQDGLTYLTIQYTYDALGNITGINDGTETRLYTYDALNQLTSEIIYTNSTKIGTKVTYSYDRAGNLVSKTKSVYNDGIVSNSTTDSYTYGDSDWGDLLTAYNGEGITYDANGNPLSYYNGKRYTFSWQYGRRLASLGVDGKTYTYTYNAEGLRVTKTVDGVVHSYFYDGTELLMEKWGNCYLRFTYDEQGRPFSVDYYNGTVLETYYYVLNLQGDVIEIRNSINNVVCKYTYDAWGKILSIKDDVGNAITAAGHIGNLNPLRYRGYYYDSETGLYYLRSRYYDPVVCRFVNADGYVSTGQDITGYNMFAYCGNNPVMGYDPTGCWDWGVFADIVVTVVATAVAIGVGVGAGVVTYANTGSINAAVGAGAVAGEATFGAINNATNAVYYNYISDGEAELETNSEHSSYVDEYVSRWDRLDYAKQETGEEKYNLNAWRHYSEYSLHMYGWYATGWAKDMSIPIFSDFAESCYTAEIDSKAWDSRTQVKMGTLIFGILGL